MTIEQIKGLIIDLDGVVFEGDHALGNIEAWFKKIQDARIGVVIATNNSSKTSDFVVSLLAKHSVRLEIQEVITSAMVTLEYLKAKYPFGSKVYVIGTQVLKTTLADGGYTIINDRSCRADAVIVGIDKTVTYDKLKDASLHIREGAEFIATNDDRTVRSSEGLVPAAGTIVAAVETASSQKPVVMGKPHKPMFEVALKQLGLEAKHVMMIGDQIETDISGGQASGCKTAMVLTGVTDDKAANAWQPEIDIVAKDMGAVVDLLLRDDGIA